MALTTQKNLGTDFTQGRIMPLLFRFFLPFLLANALNSLYNTVDTVIIGHFLGSYGIVAVSMGGKMLALYTHISTALAGAGQVFISQQIGAKRRDELNSTIGTMFTEVIVLSVLLAGFTLCFGEELLRVMNTPEESIPSALSYLNITAVGLPLIFGYNAVSSVLRGMGDSKSPLLFISIATVMNIVLDIVFIVCFDMGVAGTALATVIGQGASLLFSVVLLYRRRDKFGFDFRLKSFAVDTAKLWVLLRLGVPMALRAIFIICTQMYMLSFVNTYGLIASAAYNVADKIYHLSNIVSMSVREAGGTIVAQNVGAGKQERVKETVKCVAVVAFSAAGVLSLLSLLFPVTMFGLFTSEAEVLAQAGQFMPICCVVYILSAAIAPYEGVVSGTGNAKLSFIGGMLDGVVCRVTFGFFFGMYLGWGAPGFFMGDALARLGIVVVGAVYYHTGAWKKHSLIKGKAVKEE